MGVGGEVLVVVGAAVWQCKWGDELLGQKPKIEPPGLDFRHAIGNGVGGRWSGLIGSGR
jgi:hypothetical protein